MTPEQFKEQTEANPQGMMFIIRCMKCDSNDVIIETENDLSCGTEYTGMWGSASAIMKCKQCGNAYAIKIIDM